MPAGCFMPQVTGSKELLISLEVVLLLQILTFILVRGFSRFLTQYVFSLFLKSACSLLKATLICFSATAASSEYIGTWLWHRSVSLAGWAFEFVPSHSKIVQIYLPLNCAAKPIFFLKAFGKEWGGWLWDLAEKLTVKAGFCSLYICWN